MDEDLLSKKHFHLVGIGGIGMSALARLLLSRGIRVSGSDVTSSALTQALAREGATIFQGHQAEQVDGAQVLVYSSAVTKENPERLQAQRLGIPCLSRGELLALLFNQKKGIAVAGSHGKTTTSTLMTLVLQGAGEDPIYTIGGILLNTGRNASWSQSDFFVAETDESDGSFLKLTPSHAIVTNIDREHLDYYGSFEKAKEAYRSFMEKIRPEGLLVACVDDSVLAQEVQSIRKKQLRTVGITEAADLRAEAIVTEGHTTSFSCCFRSRPLGRIRWNVPGFHNVQNALGVIALGTELGIPFQKIAQALCGFQGIRRRMELRWQTPELWVLEDYAHHPTEIQATLRAVRQMAGERRLITLFQPHRYTRTHLLHPSFGPAFEEADSVLVTDIYAASETPIPGVTASWLTGEMDRARPDTFRYLSREDLKQHLIETLRPRDVLCILGAGDITAFAQDFAQAISQGELPWLSLPAATQQETGCRP